MSSASVATDMLRITEKLGQSKLQYRGFSYGSVLGQYFAAMYPDKVGRVIIDGIYDAEDYRQGNWLTNLVDTDAAISSLYDFCHQARPQKCSIYASSPSDIHRRVGNLIANITSSPIPVPVAPSGPAIIGKDHIHTDLFYAPAAPLIRFREFAEAIIALESNNQPSLERQVDGVLSYKCTCSDDVPWKRETEAVAAISCGDAEPIHDGAVEYEQYFAKLLEMSPFAAQIWGMIRLRCVDWMIRLKWRYTGAFAAGITSHPLLIISTAYDPVSPLSDARQVQASRFKGSALLVQDSYGHCSLSAPSICKAKYVRTYFENGTLPQEGTHCEVEELPFVGKVGATIMSAEDGDLLDALNELMDTTPMLLSSRPLHL